MTQRDGSLVLKNGKYRRVLGCFKKFLLLTSIKIEKKLFNVLMVDCIFTEKVKWKPLLLNA